MKSQLIDNKKPLLLELQLVNTRLLDGLCVYMCLWTQTHEHITSARTRVHTHPHIPQHKVGQA